MVAILIVDDGAAALASTSELCAPRVSSKSPVPLGAQPTMPIDSKSKREKRRMSMVSGDVIERETPDPAKSGRLHKTS